MVPGRLGAKSSNAKQGFTLFRHSVRSPGRIPDDPHVGDFHSRDTLNLGLGVRGNGVTHPTTLSGECHLHVHLASALSVRSHLEIIYKAEIHDIDGNLGVETGPQLSPDFRREVLCWDRLRCGFRTWRLCRNLHTNCIRVLTGESEQSSMRG